MTATITTATITEAATETTNTGAANVVACFAWTLRNLFVQRRGLLEVTTIEIKVGVDLPLIDFKHAVQVPLGLAGKLIGSAAFGAGSRIVIGLKQLILAEVNIG